jgi:DNA-binding Lrp family transcriptional regulator
MLFTFMTSADRVPGRSSTMNPSPAGLHDLASVNPRQSRGARQRPSMIAPSAAKRIGTPQCRAASRCGVSGQPACPTGKGARLLPSAAVFAGLPLVSRFRSSHTFAAPSDANFGFGALLVAAGRTEARMVPFFVQIKCQLGKSYEVANKLADAELASEIYSTAGDYDLLVKFYVDEKTDIGHFVNEKVQTIPGIQDTHTIITFKAF